MEYALSEHMTFKKLLRSALPCILMMIAISVYSVVDGFFVSNFAGKAAFSGLNLIFPVVMVLGSLGFMMGTGGSALVAKRFGEKREEEGNRCFSNCFFFTILLGVVSSLAVVFFLPQIATAMGADEEMLPHCLDYGRIMVLGVTAFNLQNMFQSFFTAAEKARLGFLVTMIAGVVNIAMDAILIVGAKLGVIGAAIGTVTGQCVGAIIPIFYFARKNPSLLRLRPAPFHWPSVGRMSLNGLSEFLANISASAVSIVLNIGLMRHFGQNGVGAYGIICYVWLIFAACFIGFNIAIAPRVSYALGAQNKEELQNLFRKAMVILLGFGLLQCSLSLALAVPLAHAFAGYDEALLSLTIHASLIYSLVYLFLGFNMFGSSFFTALNNGVVSLILSVMRLGVIELLCIILLPSVMGGEGLWWSIPIAEGIGMFMNIGTMAYFGRKYGYLPEPEPQN